MADLDAELLALAGDESSDEDNITYTQQPARNASPSLSPGEAQSASKESTTARKPKKSRKMSKHDDSEEGAA